MERSQNAEHKGIDCGRGHELKLPKPPPVLLGLPLHRRRRRPEMPIVWPSLNDHVRG